MNVRTLFVALVLPMAAASTSKAIADDYSFLREQQQSAIDSGEQKALLQQRIREIDAQVQASVPGYMEHIVETLRTVIAFDNLATAMRPNPRMPPKLLFDGQLVELRSCVLGHCQTEAYARPTGFEGLIALHFWLDDSVEELDANWNPTEKCHVRVEMNNDGPPDYNNKNVGTYSCPAILNGSAKDALTHDAANWIARAMASTRCANSVNASYRAGCIKY